MNDHRRIGAYWEREAESFLNARGLTTVQRNFNCRLGEIDLILLDGDCLVFAEVRYRRSPAYGSGAESVTATKRARLIRAAETYLRQRRALAHRPCRFDVLSLHHARGRLQIDWIRNAFSA